jgi:hypothetical protein
VYSNVATVATPAMIRNTRAMTNPRLCEFQLPITQGAETVYSNVATVATPMMIRIARAIMNPRS